MGMFNHLFEIKSNGVRRARICNTYFLTYARKTTDSGLVQWIDFQNHHKGFRLNNENVTVLNLCSLLVIVDGIKQKGGKAELHMKVNGIIVKSYSEDSKKKLKLLRLTFAGQFNANDVINIAVLNVSDVQLTIFGQ